MTLHDQWLHLSDLLPPAGIMFPAVSEHDLPDTGLLPFAAIAELVAAGKGTDEEATKALLSLTPHQRRIYVSPIVVCALSRGSVA